MASRFTAFTAAALLAATLAAPALAGTSTSSLVSDSISTSIGTSSDSISDSSRVSSGKPPRVAAGDYQVLEVAEIATKPGRVALRLQGAAEAFTLEVPVGTLAKNPVQVGDTLTASERPYGTEFAVAKTKNVFFLVLDDATHREIETRPVTL